MAARRTVQWFIDTHYTLKQERDELLAEVKEVKKEIDKVADEALERFGKEGIEGARGAQATAYIEERDHFNMEDRRKFEAYVKRTGHFELFQGRVSAGKCDFGRWCKGARYDGSLDAESRRGGIGQFDRNDISQLDFTVADQQDRFVTAEIHAVNDADNLSRHFERCS